MADNSEPEMAPPADVPDSVVASDPPESYESVVADRDSLRRDYVTLMEDYGNLAATAGEDIRQISLALGLGEHARPYSVHQMVLSEVIPAIHALRGNLPVKPAGDTGIPEIDLGGGRKAQLVGRKLPDDVARQLGLK